MSIFGNLRGGALSEYENNLGPMTECIPKLHYHKTLSVQFSSVSQSVVQFYARPKVVWATLAILQDDSARGPERFGRRWRLSRMSLREAPSGLGATGAPPEQFYARPRVVWASLASLNNDSPFGFHKLRLQ